jgi:hypothetical protein
VAGCQPLLAPLGIDGQVAGNAKDEAAGMQHLDGLFVDLDQLQVGFLGHVGGALAVAHAPGQELQQVVVVLLETCQQPGHGRRQHR